MIEPLSGPTEQPARPDPASAWRAALDIAATSPSPPGPPSASPPRLPPGPGGRPAKDLLAGTVTPPLVRRALERAMTPEQARATLAATIGLRADGARAIRARLRDQVAQGTPLDAMQAANLIRLFMRTQPLGGAGPAVRSLLRADRSGALAVTPEGRDGLTMLYEAHGYAVPVEPGPPSAARDGLPANVSEPDRVAARLLARASGAWHPAAPHPRPALARVPVAVIDDGFATEHPLLAPKLADPASLLPGAASPDDAADLPETHPPGTAREHGTRVAAVLAGGTHVIDIVALRSQARDGRTFPLLDRLRLAAEAAPIVNRSQVTAHARQEVVAIVNRAIAETLRAHPERLFVLPAGNRPDPEEGPDAAPQDANLAFGQEPNVLTVGFVDERGEPDPARFYYDPDRLATTALGAYTLPLTATGDATAGDGTSYAAPVAARVAAIATALAPHLPPISVKRLIEATTTATPAWEVQGAGLARQPPVDSDRALRLAALLGLVAHGASSAAATPGMTPAQAADALRLRADERAQALADHARFVETGG